MQKNLPTCKFDTIIGHVSIALVQEQISEIRPATKKNRALDEETKTSLIPAWQGRGLS